MANILDLSQFTNEELYKMGRANVKVVRSRRDRLLKAFKTEPESISYHALNKLNKEGLPTIRKDMHRGALKANVQKSIDLRAMKTGTVTGARANQDRMFRAATGSPTTGKLDEKQTKKYEDFKTRFKDTVAHDEDLLTQFWDGFKYYKSSVAYKLYDPERELKDYQAIFEYELYEGNSTDPEDLTGIIDAKVTDAYEKEEAERQLLVRHGREGGFRR